MGDGMHRRSGGAAAPGSVVRLLLLAAFATGMAAPAGSRAGGDGGVLVDDLGDFRRVSSRSCGLGFDATAAICGDASRVMRNAVSSGAEWIEYHREGSTVARWRFIGLHWMGWPIRPFAARFSRDGRTYEPWPMASTTLCTTGGWSMVEYRCAAMPTGARCVAIAFPDIDNEQWWNPRLSKVEIEYVPNETPPAPSSAAAAQVYRLENPGIEVTCAASNGLMTLRDRRSGEVWTQKAAELWPWELLDANRTDGVLRLHYAYRCPILATPSDFRVEVRVAAAAPEVTFDIDADPRMPVPDFAYPAPFHSGGDDAFAVFPSREGRLLAENSRNPRFASAVVSDEVIDRAWPDMRCFGVVRLRSGAAYGAILETPDDGLIGRTDLRDDGTDVLGLTPLWQSEMGRFGYRRRVSYRLFPEGGYVAMAKHYRRYCQDHGMFRSLRDKARALPLLEPFTRGAFLDCANMHDGDMVPIVRMLRAQGYDGTFTDDGDGWYRKGGPMEWAYRVLGHHPGGSVCYKDLLPREAADFAILQKNRDGRYTVGWMLGNTVMAAICQDRIREYAGHYLPYFLQAYQCDFLYHDTTSAMPLQECHHPDHPLTRRQEKQKKIALLKWMMDQGTITASEDAADWAAADLAVLAGPDSRGHLQGTPVPFFNLVFHDAVVPRYRVDWTLHDKPETFAQKKAHSILYGVPSAFRWRQDLDARQREEICRTSIGIQKFYEQVAFRELVDHRFLNDDLTLETCSFAGAEAYANFSSSAARIELPGGPVELPPCGYLARAEGFLAFDELRQGVRCEHVRSPGFVFVDTAAPFESDALTVGTGGGRVSASRLSPGRMLVFNETAASPRFAFRRLDPQWDDATARAYRLNDADERIGDVPLVRDGPDWTGVSGTGVLEVACGPAAACSDLRVVPGSIRFSETQLRGGEPVTVSATVTNVAAAPAEAEVRFYLDRPESEDGLLAVRPLTLGAHAGATVSAAVRLAGAQGRRSIWAMAKDRAGLEVNRLNNADSAFLEIGEPFHARFLRRAFDFGTGACQPGFVPVLDQPYEAGRGWGWVAPTNSPALQGLLGAPSLGQPSAGRMYVVACKGLNWAGPLLGDAIGMGRYQAVGQASPPAPADYTFVADVPNGDYRVTAIMVSGVRAWQTEAMIADVFLNGTLLASPATHKYEKGHFFLTRDVRVTDGQVRLRFVGDWWQLCGLTMADAASARRAGAP